MFPRDLFPGDLFPIGMFPDAGGQAEIVGPPTPGGFPPLFGLEPAGSIKPPGVDRVVISALGTGEETDPDGGSIYAPGAAGEPVACTVKADTYATPIAGGLGWDGKQRFLVTFDAEPVPPITSAGQKLVWTRSMDGDLAVPLELTTITAAIPPNDGVSSWHVTATFTA